MRVIRTFVSPSKRAWLQPTGTTTAIRYETYHDKQMLRYLFIKRGFQDTYGLQYTCRVSTHCNLQRSLINLPLVNISTATANATSRNVSKTTGYTRISFPAGWRRSKIPGPS